MFGPVKVLLLHKLGNGGLMLVDCCFNCGQLAPDLAVGLGGVGRLLGLNLSDLVKADRQILEGLQPRPQAIQVTS